MATLECYGGGSGGGGGGITTTANGGTGANLSATGGVGQYVKQLSPGQPFAVGPISSADLAAALASPPSIGLTTPGAIGAVSLLVTPVNGATGISVAGVAQTGASFPALSVAQTWDNSGTVFTAAGVYVTSTAAGTDSLVLDLQVDASSVFNVDQYGDVVAAGTAFVNAVTTPGQITSTLASGTAPFAVASTTLVPNLYVARAALADLATTVTTNANLTGPITSSGNATAVAAQTGTGSTFVMQASPTLTTPNLGTPSAGVLTNCTGTAPSLSVGFATSAGYATTAGAASSASTASLAANVTTNANLTGPITSVGNATSVAAQTGTGSTFVMQASPALTTPNIGTPSAGVLTNCTGTAAGLTAGNASQLLGSTWAAPAAIGSGTAAAATFTALSAGSSGTQLTVGASVIVGGAALALTATDGFLFVPTCAGVPTGTPTTYGSTAALVYDTTDFVPWWYCGGAWHQALSGNALAGGQITYAGVTAGLTYLVGSNNFTYGSLGFQIGGFTTPAFTVYTADSSVVAGSAALATNATGGFLYIPSCAGVPTGAPSAHGATVPLVYNTTGTVLYAYSGNWITVGIGGTVATGQVPYGAATANTVAGSAALTFTPTGGLALAPTAVSSGAQVALTVTGAANTLQTSGTEVNDVLLNLARTVQWATSTPSTQRAVYLEAPTYSCNTAAQTIATAATLAIGGAPANGTNVTITSSYALWVAAGTTQLQATQVASLTNSGLSAGYVVYTGAGGLESASSALAYTPTTGINLTPTAVSSGAQVAFTITGATNTLQTASTEVNDVHWNLAHTVQWATAPPATQRAVYIQAPTYSCNTATQTITTGATLAISGAPTGGTNVTITSAYALWVQAGTTQLQATQVASLTNSGLTAGYVVYTGTGGLESASATLAFTPTTGLTIAPSAVSSGAQTALTVTSAANTAQTTTADIPDVYFNLSATKTWAAGAIAEADAFLINPPTYAFAGASTISAASTLTILGPPLAGANCTITNSYSLLIQNGYMLCEPYVYAGGAAIQGAGYALGTSGSMFALEGFMVYSPASTSTGAYYGLGGIASSTQGNQGGTLGGLFGQTVLYTGSTGTYTAAYGIVGTVQNQSAAVISTAAGMYMNSPTNTGGGSITVYYGLYIASATAATTNYAIYTQNGLVNFGDQTTIAPPVYTSGAPVSLTITGAANTGLTTATQVNDVYFNLARTVQWATGGITSQSAVLINAPTYAFVGASTITTAATVSITGAPAAGTHATLTKTYAFWVQAGITQLQATQVTTLTAATSITDSGLTAGYVMYTGTSGLLSASATMTFTPTTGLAIAPTAVSSGLQTALTVTTAANTSQTTTDEVNGIKFNMSATRTWATGAITTQREVLVQAPTYAFAGASIVTTAATVWITGPPVAGSNATLTNAYSLVAAGQVVLGSATNTATVPTANTFAGCVIFGRNNASTDVAGAAGETIDGAGTSSYTNYTTTATYQQIDTISLTAGKWLIWAVGTFSSDGGTLTASTNAIFTISGTTASASGTTEGLGDILYTDASIESGVSNKSSVTLYKKVNITATTSYFLNSQCTFTAGTPQFVGSIHAVRLP